MTLNASAPDALLADNPLLASSDLPRFDLIQPAHVRSAVDAAIAAHAAAMARCAALPGDPAILLAKELADVALGQVWGVVGHLLSVTNTPEWRAAHAETQPLVQTHLSAVGQDKALYNALKAVPTAALDAEQARALKLTLREFELSGVALEGEAAQSFALNSVAQGRLASDFANAVMDATQAWTYDVADPARLTGVPEADLQAMAAAAQAAGIEGWRVTLHAPSVSAVLTHAQDRALRRAVYEANATRASDQGPHAGQFDNSARMREILQLRASAAEMLGFGDPVEVSLATKMARDADEVERFLTGLAAAARPKALADMDDLVDFARSELDIADPQPWDVAFVSERMRRARHALDSTLVREHLQLDRVLTALFALMGELFGLEVRETPTDGASPVWHPDVRQFTLHLAGTDTPVAAFFADFHAREGKRGGAWMNVCRPRLDAGQKWPVAYLVTNFAARVPNRPTTINHSDMVTLFHEMGHCLHHMLGTGNVPSISGINGVEWDAVELPSQFLENFAWEPALLKAASAHVETGAPLPDVSIERMLAARSFQRALGLVRQIEFALFDLRLHRAAGHESAPNPQAILDAVRAEVAVIAYPQWHRFAHAFSHIFAGGYAAGYYSYLWAERLSADAYGAFEEPDIDRTKLGTRFAAEVLERGATRPAIESFVAFRGREPDNDPLLRAWGIAA